MLLIGVLADGRAGVRRVVEILGEELERTMSYVGFPTVGELDATALRRVGDGVLPGGVR